MKPIILFLLSIISFPAFSAQGIYQTPEAFLLKAFDSKLPKPKALWITKKLKPAIEAIMAHKMRMLRVRYWGKNQRTAWVLEEIGKEKPITVGIVINHNKIERIKVLEFRESRGWEVIHPFYTEQFKNAGLPQDHYLSSDINGISGATLSVRALTKLSRLALFLHQQTPFK